MDWTDLIPGALSLFNTYNQGQAVSGAANTGNAATLAAIKLQQDQYDQTRRDNELRRYVGDNALLNMTNLSNYDPTPSAADVMATPGYQFGLDQGVKAREGSAAAKGGLYSGNALKELTRYGNDYGTGKFQEARNNMTTDFGNRWNRLSTLSGSGQAAQNQVQAAGQNYASNVGNLGLSNAGYQGAAGVAQSNIYGNAANELSSQGKTYGWWK
jgi:hypothetical protein